jgi:hypothetical protein
MKRWTDLYDTPEWRELNALRLCAKCGEPCNASILGTVNGDGENPGVIYFWHDGRDWKNRHEYHIRDSVNFQAEVRELIDALVVVRSLEGRDCGGCGHPRHVHRCPAVADVYPDGPGLCPCGRRYYGDTDGYSEMP